MLSKTQFIIVLVLTSGFVSALSFTEAYAVSSISWQQSGSDISEGALQWGDVFGTNSPATIRVEDSNLASNSIDDKIDVQIIGDQTGDSVTLTLSEIGDSGVFISQGIILTQGVGRYQVTDTVTYQVQDDDCAGNPCDPNKPDILNGTSFEALSIFSDTDNFFGIQIDLVETGDNTLTFRGTFDFTLNSSNGSSIQVAEGDVITIFDDNSFEFVNALIIPSDSDKGAISAVPLSVGEILPDTYFVTANYDSILDGGVTDSLAIAADDPPGRGGGGLLRPGLVVDSSDNSGGGGCSGDCGPPTLGLIDEDTRVVENGFSYNGNPIDVELFYTPYPLIITEVGKENVAILKIFEDGGTRNLEHVELAFGLKSGQVISESKAVINWDRTFDGREHVTLHDPENSLENVRVIVEKDRCNSSDVTQCTVLNIFHTFRAPLDFNIVGTNVWDFKKNAWQNFYNHGIEIIGESLNPPEQYLGIHNGKLITITEIGKDKAIDVNGHTWTFNKGWRMDYTFPQKEIRPLLSSEMESAIKHLLGEENFDSSSMVRNDRTHEYFAALKNNQALSAETVLVEICPKCYEKSFGEINEIFYYKYPERTSKLNDPKILKLISEEKEKAEIYLDNYPQ